MDRAAEFPLQSRAHWPAGHSCKKNSQGKSFSCLLTFCLLAVFVLALPVLYLLARHLREPQACKAEETTERTPAFEKQIGTPPAPELKPRAHLEELDLQNEKCAPENFITLQWKYDNRSQSAATMKYQNGSLVIPQSGVYFVYAQVTFRKESIGNCNTETVEHNKTKVPAYVSQIILKRTSGYPVPFELMRSTSSVGETKNWHQAIYLGAIVSLKASDQLFVNVSSTSLVYNKKAVNFFGAFLI